jgi:hypothetical protein
VGVHDRLRDVEAQPETARVRAVELAVTLENARKLLLLDSRPGVFDRDLDQAARFRSPHGNLPILRAEIDGVGQEIRKDLKNPVVVSWMLAPIFSRVFPSRLRNTAVLTVMALRRFLSL